MRTSFSRTGLPKASIRRPWREMQFAWPPSSLNHRSGTLSLSRTSFWWHSCSGLSTGRPPPASKTLERPSTTTPSARCTRTTTLILAAPLRLLFSAEGITLTAKSVLPCTSLASPRGTKTAGASPASPLASSWVQSMRGCSPPSSGVVGATSRCTVYGAFATVTRWCCAPFTCTCMSTRSPGKTWSRCAMTSSVSRSPSVRCRFAARLVMLDKGAILAV